jgi:hypothetical protein
LFLEIHSARGALVKYLVDVTRLVAEARVRALRQPLQVELLQEFGLEASNRVVRLSDAAEHNGLWSGD